MSFSFDVKNEILDIWQKKSCCKLCEAYGLILFSSKYSKRGIYIKTENEAVAQHYRSMIKKVCSVVCDTQKSEKGVYTVSVPIWDMVKVYSCFGDEHTFVKKHFKCEGCTAAFIRGAFLSCGTISDPEREYHIEFASRSEQPAYELCKMLRNIGLDAKFTERGRRYVVYLKESENIEDLLTLMGASKSAIKIMDTKILKDLRNKTNRITNFETANIKKSAQSCAKQLEAIKTLEQADKLTSLPDELYELAIMRRDNIDMSLTELGREVGLSRSGVHHRLKKIIEFADSIEK